MKWIISVPITAYRKYEVKAASLEEAMEKVASGEVPCTWNSETRSEFFNIQEDLDTNNWEGFLKGLGLEKLITKLEEIDNDSQV